MVNIASPEKIARRRQDILDAAIDIFAEKGFHASGIADIATRLGIGHGTVYRYYKNKRDIFNEILSLLLSEMSTVVQQDPPNTKSLPEYQQQLERIADRLIAIFRERPQLARIAFYESYGVDADISDAVNRIQELFAEFTAYYLQNGISKAFLRSEMDTAIAARLVTAMLMETVKHVALNDFSDKQIEPWRREIIRLMIGGLSR